MSFSTGFRKCKKCGKILFGLFDGELCDECEKAEQEPTEDATMTLDEAIKHAEEVAEENLKSYKEWLACKNRGNVGWSKSDIESVDKSIEQCKKCAEEHRQLAERLKDYKRLKEQEPTDKSNLEKICEELAAENDDLRNQLAMRDRFKQEPCDDAVEQLKKYTHGKKNTDKVEISVLVLNRIIKALEQEPCNKCVYSTKDGYCQYDDITETIPPLEPCDDVVSRKSVINTLEYMDNVLDENRTVEEYKALLKECYEVLTPVRPQEQTKEEHIDVFEVVNAPWIFLNNCANSGYYCSKCKKKLVKDGWSETVKKINFCPNCGAKMVEPQESEE